MNLRNIKCAWLLAAMLLSSCALFAQKVDSATIKNTHYIIGVVLILAVAGARLGLPMAAELFMVHRQLL